MVAPEDACGNGITSPCLCHLNAMSPVLSRDAGWMYLPADDLDRLAIGERLLLAEGERVFRTGGKAVATVTATTVVMPLKTGGMFILLVPPEPSYVAFLLMPRRIGRLMPSRDCSRVAISISWP